MLLYQELSLQVYLLMFNKKFTKALKPNFT
jgi:hypothetical protein